MILEGTIGLELGGEIVEATAPDTEALTALAEQYDVVMEIESIPRLAAAHDLDLGRRG